VGRDSYHRWLFYGSKSTLFSLLSLLSFFSFSLVIHSAIYHFAPSAKFSTARFPGTVGELSEKRHLAGSLAVPKAQRIR
jgi:hypothetical protein